MFEQVSPTDKVVVPFGEYLLVADSAMACGAQDEHSRAQWVELSERCQAGHQTTGNGYIHGYPAGQLVEEVVEGGEVCV